MRWSNQTILNGQFSTMNHEYSISFECFAVFLIIELYFPPAFLTWNPDAKQMQNSPRNLTWDDIDIFKICMLDSTHSYIFKMQISLAPYWYVMDTKGTISGILQKTIQRIQVSWKCEQFTRGDYKHGHVKKFLFWKGKWIKKRKRGHLLFKLIGQNRWYVCNWVGSKKATKIQVYPEKNSFEMDLGSTILTYSLYKKRWTKTFFLIWHAWQRVTGMTIFFK